MMRFARLAALGIPSVLLASLPAQASLVYAEPLLACGLPPLEFSEAPAGACGGAEGGVGVGDAPGHLSGDAPPDEYLDPYTDVVYRLDGDRLTPVGVSLHAIGYVSVEAYRSGQFSGDPEADLDCLLGGDYCSPCPAVSYCATWHVALAGHHDVRIEQQWVNHATPRCIPSRVVETAPPWMYEGGGLVTKMGDTYYMMPPMSGCGVGEYTIQVFVGNDPEPYVAKVRYGPTQCSGRLASILEDTWVYADECAPCAQTRHGNLADVCDKADAAAWHAGGV